jgi:hypothetical protein
MTFDKSEKNKYVSKNRTHKNKKDMNNDMIYSKNIYSNEMFSKIKNYCSQISENDMIDDTKASGRLMYVIKNEDPILKYIYNDDFIEKIRKLTGKSNLIPCKEVPVEYRKYIRGSFMDWHKDTQMLPDQLQYECVITITNTSNSRSSFRKKMRTVNVKSKPNSIIIVRANGIPHKVSKTTRGERTILKLVFKE